MYKTLLVLFLFVPLTYHLSYSTVLLSSRTMKVLSPSLFLWLLCLALSNVQLNLTLTLLQMLQHWEHQREKYLARL